MTEKRKVCVVTGTRADYGLLYWLMKEISNDDSLMLQLVVTGMHLSPEFGLTFQQIEKDGFNIDYKVEMLLSSDTAVATSKSMGLGMIGFADAFKILNPELIVVLGDRYEIFSAVSVAMVARIPVAHLHGGEATEGLIDEAIRHSITKMSHLHFTSTEEYKRRVIQLGEAPETVFNVGATGIDNINRLMLLSREECEKSIGFKFSDKNLLVTFHPVTLECSTAQQQFSNLLTALEQLENTHLIFTKANSDADGRVINKMIDDYVASHSNKAAVYSSLGQLRYLSTMKYVDGVVGNSSSGLIEAPCFKIGTINIGDRQRGRIKTESVINCNSDINSIKDALIKLYNDAFREKLKSVLSPYGSGGAAEKILSVIRTQSLENIIKKKFYNFESTSCE